MIKENREMDHNAPCIDIDECKETHVDFTFECDMNSKCQNSYGSYYCVCNDGYEGDGKTCDRLIPENAECRDTECLELRCQIGLVISFVCDWVAKTVGSKSHLTDETTSLQISLCD